MAIKKDYEKYDMFKHGAPCKIWNNHTKKYGRVTKIVETAPEWIEPVVDYGDGKQIKEITWRLKYVPE